MKHETRSEKPAFPGAFLVGFYRLWHGYLHLKGAGYLIGKLAPVAESLQNYPLRLTEGHCIMLDFRDISGACWLNRSLGDNFEETGLLKAMAAFVQADTTVWDVGANCGIVSYLLAKTTPARRIIFFEPIKAMFSLACSALIPFPQALGFNMALSDKTGGADLIVPHRNSTTATLNPETTVRSGGRLRITCVTGDELVAGGRAPAPNVIKIDTEGHEANVMKGLRETICKHRPVVFFEHLSLSNAQVQAMIPEGYDIFAVGSLDGTLKKGFDRAHGHNSALIPR